MAEIEEGTVRTQENLLSQGTETATAAEGVAATVGETSVVEEAPAVEAADADGKAGSNGMDDSYLIFSIKKYRYALKSSNIQQIVHAQKVRELPFVPKYIEGILNVHGNPYTVVNTLMLDGEVEPEISGLSFIVLKRDDDQFCIHVSNIELFFEPEDDDVFEDKVKYKQQFIELFDADRIEAALRRDLMEDDV